MLSGHTACNWPATNPPESSKSHVSTEFRVQWAVAGGGGNFERACAVAAAISGKKIMDAEEVLENWSDIEEDSESEQSENEESEDDSSEESENISDSSSVWRQKTGMYINANMI